MEQQNVKKTNPWVVALIFIVSAVVVFSTVFLVLYLTSDFKEIKANKTEYYVNVGESVELDLTFTNVDVQDYEIVSQNPAVAAYNTSTGFVDGISGGKVAIVINANIPNFTPIALTVTVCDGVTTETAFLIDSKEDLESLNTDPKMLNKHYKLIEDINLLNEEWTPIGFIGDNYYEYNGVFNFNGHKIENLKITQTSYEYAGLFAKIGTNGYIDGLNLNNVLIENNSITGKTLCATGSFAGLNKGIIKNVYITNSELRNANTTGQEVMIGGVVGYNTGVIGQVSFENSKIRSNGYAGGIAGVSTSVNSTLATVKQSAVEADIYGSSHIGGVVGLAQGSIVADSYSGKTTSLKTANTSAKIGGVIGSLQYSLIDSSVVDSMVINCYSVASFGSFGYKGSIIGWNVNYSAANLQFNKIYGCYFAEEDTGVSNAIALTQNGESTQISLNNIAAQDFSVLDTFVSYLGDTGDNVMWDFDNIWVLNPGAYPTLVKNGEASNSDDATVKIDGAIYDAVDLINIQNNMAGDYVLKANIDLSTIANWNAIGANGDQFTGSFIADVDPATLNFYKISNLTTTDENAGLFNIVGQNAKISNITLDGVNVNGGKNVGLIAVTNYGTIENCNVVNANVKLGDSEGAAGFVVANNKGTIRNSHVNNSEIIAGENGKFLLGGVAGENTGIITKCSTKENTKITANTNNENVFVGGITALNSGAGEVRFSYSKGAFTGSYVGGLVAVNKNSVYESYSQNTLTGNYVGGLAYLVSFDNGNDFGSISNCYTLSTLNGVDKKSAKSGFACIIDYCQDGENAGKYGLVYHCFSAAAFDDKGKNYFETSSEVRNDSIVFWFGLVVERDAGFIVDSIYDKQGRDAIVATDGINGLWDPTRHEEAIGLITMECYEQVKFTEQGFLTSIWSFSGSWYPELINVVK